MEQHGETAPARNTPTADKKGGETPPTEAGTEGSSLGRERRFFQLLHDYFPIFRAISSAAGCRFRHVDDPARRLPIVIPSFGNIVDIFVTVAFLCRFEAFQNGHS